MFLSSAILKPLTRKPNLMLRLLSSKPNDVTAVAVLPENSSANKQRMVTGIQPTGVLHLGNYLGVMKNWVEQQHIKDHSFLCISDMHSITMTRDPPKLRENIFRMAASLLACGVDPQYTTLYVQSAVKEHSELCWILGSMSSMTNLGHQPMYMEKTRLSQEMSLGIFTYPVMQAADILLYKATHVPIGEDQLPHIRFAQSLLKRFNDIYGPTFPNFQTIMAENHLSRVRCLSDPSKKMSKSSDDQRSVIYVNDEPDNIVAKINGATTDFSSDVGYDPDKRVGISNLISMHAYIVGKSPKEIVLEAASMDTLKYKTVVAETIIEHLTPIRRKYQDLIERRDDLTFKLDTGSTRAHAFAAETMDEVKQKMGMGAQLTPVKPISKPEDAESATANENDEIVKRKRRQINAYAHVPIVPQQKIRGEKSVQYKMAIRNNRFFSTY